MDFHNNKFNSIEKNLLHELDSLRFFNSIPQRIFIEIPKDKRDELLSEKYFNFMPLYPNKTLNDGFIMTLSGALFMDRKYASMTNRTFVFERENGTLILVNSFKGSIKELKDVNSNTPSDIVIEFKSEKEGVYFYCIFNWINRKYIYSSCERISYDQGRTQHFIKTEEQEKVTKEVEKIIKEESFAF